MLKVGDSAPDFRLNVLEDGRVFHLREALEHGPVLLIFVKESCPTCRMTLKYLDPAFATASGDRGQMVYVAQDMPWMASDLVQELDLKATLLLDEAPYEVGASFQLEFVPSAFYVNREGKIEAAAESFQREALASMVENLALENDADPPTLYTPNDLPPAFRPG